VADLLEPRVQGRHHLGGDRDVAGFERRDHAVGIASPLAIREIWSIQILAVKSLI
jgi:hypothetical protein